MNEIEEPLSELRDMLEQFKNEVRCSSLAAAAATVYAALLERYRERLHAGTDEEAEAFKAKLRLEAAATAVELYKIV